MGLQALDLLLAFAVIVLGWRIVTTRSLFGAVVLFMVFGLLVALAWARLGAVDVALAEAAIGAGITGALLLFAYRDLKSCSVSLGAAYPPPLRIALAVLSAALGAAVAAAVVAVRARPMPLIDAVTARLDDSGVRNPVTAVLLNFRGYDTMLEVAVLFAALLAALTIRPGFDLDESFRLGDPGLAHALGRVVTPAAVVIGGYLVWAGAYVPGGAFPAGAVGGAALVLLVWTGHFGPRVRTSAWLRVLAVAGPAVFLTTALVTFATTGTLLHYPRNAAGTLILGIELGVTVSIAVTLVLLCMGTGGFGRRTA